MKERCFLKENETLTLWETVGEEQFPRAFHIRRGIRKGGSVLCYEASHAGSAWGVLKEFYPAGNWDLRRNERGQLCFGEGGETQREAFRREQERYLRPFELVRRAKREDGGGELQTFLPAFALYRGEGDAEAAYIWTEERESTTFAALCEQIHSAPDQQPEQQMVTVLQALCALTRCLRSLHSRGLIHRDIKPDNFGFSTLGQQIQTQDISLFDINTLCALNPLPRDYAGSEGFAEPWEPGYTADCKTDIYSVGACLFHAVVITEEPRKLGSLYRQELFDRLRELVRTSQLVTAMDENARKPLEELLVKILSKCLCRKKDRFSSCDQLLEMLEQALFYAEPMLQTARSRTGERWILQGVREFLTEEQEERSSLALRYHLYRHPLVPAADGKGAREPRDLNVAVLGLGKYSRQFLDICLMVGQLPGYRLHVTVLARDQACWEEYLAQRPALKDFFLLGSHDCDEETHYGSILFRQAELSDEDETQNQAILEDTVLSMAEEAWQPDFVFAALGSPELTLNAALACYEAARCLDMAFDIHFIWENAHLPEGLPETVIPAQVLADVTRLPEYVQIERMAFNVHLVWEKRLNLPFSEIRAEYRDPYNHHSCLDYVLSLQAKLRVLGIDLRTLDVSAAAEVFSGTDLLKARRREFICYEHRRWVTEKLVQGWRPMDDLEECLQTGTRDKRGKRHACILRSTPHQALKEMRWKENGYAKWDTATEAELATLDELDRMSVELHRVFLRRSQEIRRQGLLDRSDVEDLGQMLKGDLTALAAFREWYTCVKEIWNGDYSQFRRYDGLLEALWKAAEKTLPKTECSYFKKQLDAFQSMFRPIVWAVEYRDYKQDDAALIDNIPFILTYSENICLAVPFDAGSNSRVFSNLAAAMMVNPSRLLLLAYVDRKEKLWELRKALPHMTAFMKKKQLRGRIELVCLYHLSLAGEFTPALEQELQQSCGGSFWQLSTQAVGQAEDCVPYLRKYLQRRASGSEGRLLALERNDTPLSCLLQGAGVCLQFPSYRFDPIGLQFSEIRDCLWLSHISKRPSISVADMSILSGSFSLSSNNPEFYGSYKRLWSKYREDSGTWKALCGRLGDYAAEHDVIVKFERKRDWEKGAAVERRYPVDANYHALQKVLSALVAEGIAEPESWAERGLGGPCVVTVYDRMEQGEKFDRLFSQPDRLRDPQRLSIRKNTVEHQVIVSYDDLMVTDLFLSEEQKYRFLPLLQFFDSHRDIVNLRLQGNRASFSYTDRQVKELMTVAGKILEVYTYHKAKERPFDDVVSGYELLWGGTDVKSEFDCILTKGLCTLFVECKARSSIEQDFYFKLASLEQQFGINSKAVLIADTRERPHYDHAPINAMQRARGNMMDVITIWDPEEIREIGQTLMRIIQGTYEPRQPQ